MNCMEFERNGVHRTAVGLAAPVRRPGISDHHDQALANQC